MDKGGQGVGPEAAHSLRPWGKERPGQAVNWWHQDPRPAPQLEAEGPPAPGRSQAPPDLEEGAAQPERVVTAGAASLQKELSAMAIQEEGGNDVLAGRGGAREQLDRQMTQMGGQGRARGRARGRTQSQTMGEGETRPGRELVASGSQTRPPVGGGRAVTAGEGPPAPGRSQAPPDLEEGAAQPERVVTAGAASLQKELFAMAIQEEGGNDVLVGRGGAKENLDRRMQQVCTHPDHFTSKQGTSGRVVKLMANYFEVVKRPEWTLVQYRVDFTPEEDRTSVRKKMLRLCKEELGGAYIFDGTVLYMNRRLPGDRLKTCCERGTNQEKIHVMIRMVGELKPSDHMFLQVFNILLREAMEHLKLELINHHFYDCHASIKIPEFNLELWPGYITSIRQHEHRLLLCTEIHHKVLRQDTVLKQLYVFHGHDKLNYQRMAAEALLGSIVMTRYNAKTYRIDDIDWEKSPEEVFPRRDGGDISYVEYYKQRYGEVVKDMRQPLLVSRPRRKDVHRGQVESLYLVPELCFMTGLDQSMRENFQLMKAIGQHTHQAPDKKVQVLQRFMNRLNNEPKCMEELGGFDLKFGNKLVELDGRLLEPERIVLGRAKQISAGMQADWTRDLRNSAMLRVVPLANWAVIVPQYNAGDLPGFIQTLRQAGAGMSFSMVEPLVVSIKEIRPQEYMKAIDECYSNVSPQILMIILASNRKDMYGAIKKHCYVERGMPSQVVVARNLKSKNLISITTKIAIQINCKLGGEPWSADIPLKNCMMVGFNIYGNTKQKRTTVGALVASMNPVYTRYYTTVAMHHHQERLSHFIASNMVQALHKYKETNGKLPSHILLYRGGVGEGEVGYVKDHELTQIQESLAKIYSPNAYKFAFIIVNKGLNTSIMTAQQGNPHPGTIVDDIITLPDRYDFYLISQTVWQGTVSPTSYSVIFDTLHLEPDKVQRLTYKMCHLYFNRSGSIRVPAPCQYAHKLAYLVGEYLHSEVHENLRDTLYFL